MKWRQVSGIPYDRRILMKLVVKFVLCDEVSTIWGGGGSKCWAIKKNREKMMLEA